MKSSIFKKALSFVLTWEGGFVNNPNDKGGATNEGITQGTYNHYLKNKGIANKPVKNISNEEVEDIYYSMYWLPTGCEKMTPKFAVICFDTAVNMGVGRVKEFLSACQYNDIEAYFIARIRKYNEFAHVQNQRGFLHGWLNRVFALYDFIQKFQL